MRRFKVGRAGKKKAVKRRLIVEMRGIEPRSEEKTIEITTSIVYPGDLFRGTGKDSALAE